MKKLTVPSLALLLGLNPLVLATTTVSTTTYSSGTSTAVTDPSTVQTGSGASVTVSSGASVSYQAGTSIILNPGFTAQAGSYFNAVINVGASPSTPSALTVTGESTSAISLLWSPSTDSAGITSYNIYRNGSLYGTSTLSVFTDTSVAPGALYTYSIVAVDSGGNLSSASPAVLAVATGTQNILSLLGIGSGTPYVDTSTNLNFQVFQPR